MAAFNAINELILPAFRGVVDQPNKKKAAQGGWELSPPADDATLSLPAALDQAAHETTIGRLCELGPKVWLLCYVHAFALMGSCAAIAEGLPSSGPLTWLAHACLAFSAWSMLFLGSGIVENITRRYVWLRLLENGILLQPKPAGTVLDRISSPEHRLLCGGLGLMASLHLCVLGTAGLESFLGSAAALLILNQAWVVEWRLPSAADLLCGGPGGGVDVEFAKQLTSVGEARVAAACAALPPGTTSFVALAAWLRANAADDAAAPNSPPPAKDQAAAAPAAATAAAAADEPETTDPSGDAKTEDAAAAAAARWAAERHWAMRLIGVPPALALLQPCVQPLARALRQLPLLKRSPLLACMASPLPVRAGGGFKAAKDRTFSSRMNIWNLVFLLAVELVVASGRGGPASGRAMTTFALAAVVALAARAIATAGFDGR